MVAPKTPAGTPPKRVTPPIATVLVCSREITGKSKPLLPGLVVLFRTSTMSPIPEKARAKPADEPAAEAPPAPRPFSAGMVDRRGYLVPWEKIREERSQRKAVTTDSIKFVAPPGEDALYDFFVVSHPDPKRIEAILDNVNQYGGVFKEGGVEIKPVSLKLLRRGAKGQEHVLEIPEDPAQILPREGSSEHGGWLLYRDMPHQGCAAVSAKIQELQKALGAMRYPIGGGDSPYIAEAKVNDGVFDVRTWNGVLSFQRSYLELAGSLPGFVKTDSAKKLVGAAEAKAFADIALKEKTGSPVVPGADWPRPKRADGVVDDATGKAIQRCIQEDLRKPGHVLHPFLHEMDADNVRWLRSEAVAALGKWRELARAFGWTEGIHAFHTYRSALADVTSAAYGRATLSIHKSGYAIDLQMTGFVVPWTKALFYEKVISGSRIRWRLWGEIAVDKARLGAGIDAVAKILAERHAKTREHLQEAATAWDEANKEKKAKGKRPVVPGATDAATIAGVYRECLDDIVPGGPVFQTAAQKVSRILDLDQGDGYDRLLEQDVEHLLDDEVAAFEYHPDHPSFACDDPAFFVPRTAPAGKVFLCLTALARLAKLTGIGAFPDGWHSTQKTVTLPAAVSLPPGPAQAFAAAAQAIGTANDRYDEDLVANRGAALIDHVLRSVMNLKLGERPKKGVFVPLADPTPLVAPVPASAFGRHLSPLFGSVLDAPSTQLRSDIEALLLAFAKEAAARRIELLVAGTTTDKTLGELKTLAKPHLAKVEEAIGKFEAGRAIDSSKLWHVRITRAGTTTEIPLKDLDDAAVKSLATWQQACAKKSWTATPSVALGDVKVKVEPSVKAKADPKTRTISVDPTQPRLKALADVRGAVKDVTLELKSVYFGQPAAPPAADRKAPSPPVLGLVVAETEVGPSDDVAEGVKRVLEEAYRSDLANLHVPTLVVTPRFPVKLDVREGDTLVISYPGKPIGMEWWHHQYHPALQGEEESSEGETSSGGPKKWSALLTEIGWELDVLGEGPGAAAYGYLGVGYSAKDLQKNAS